MPSSLTHSHPLPPTTLLLPLLSSTASLSIAVWEYLTFSSILSISRTHPVPVSRTISLYWRTALAPTLTLIIALGLTSITSGIRLLRRLPSGSTRHLVAIAGTVFATAHFAFAPAVAARIQRMAEAYDGLGGVEAEEEARAEVVEERVVGALREWVGLHVWRSVVVDGPAMGCFAWLAIGGGQG